MKTFAVRLEGTGICLPGEPTEDPAIGFFATRWVKASNATQAHELARANVLAEWAPSAEYGRSNSGNIPEVVVEGSWLVGYFKALVGRKPSGYTFYSSL